jgi:hypothetical protein
VTRKPQRREPGPVGRLVPQVSHKSSIRAVQAVADGTITADPHGANTAHTSSSRHPFATGTQLRPPEAVDVTSRGVYSRFGAGESCNASGDDEAASLVLDHGGGSACPS